MFSQTPNLQPIAPSYRTQVLDDRKLHAIRAGTLEILENVGIHCPSMKVQNIYREHGALVDPEKNIVRLPSDIVLDALSQAPRVYTMGARKPSHHIHLDGKALYCATDGCGIEVIDFDTRERRNSRKEDVAVMARIADYLPSIGFYWPVVSAQDYPQIAPLHELDASFNNTTKHVQTETVMDAKMARYAVEMASVVAGSSDNLSKNPPLSSLICTIAPLAQDQGGMEAALVFAEAGLPVGFMSMANVGSTGPATIAGTLVAADAEIVAALALIQLAHPGAPVYHSMMPGIMNPRTGGYLATAWEGEVMYAAGVELAHSWGVPSLAGVFGTDAMQPGWQSAAESAACLLLCAMCGAETGAGLGLLESCNLLYPEAIVLDSDVYHKVRILAEGLDTSREALSLDIIKEVGPRGHFLRQKHTRKHIRNLEFSELTGQLDVQGNSMNPVEVAREKVDWIRNNHRPEPLDESEQSELKLILQTAEIDFSSKRE